MQNYKNMPDTIQDSAQSSSPVACRSNSTNVELSILAHNIRSLYNVGSLFRLADGLGLTKLYLTGHTGAPHNRLKYQRQRQQIAKTALEGLDSVQWEYHEDPEPIISHLKQQGVTIIALELTDSSQDIARLSTNGPLCLILGHETDGVSDQLLRLSDLVTHIPMRGQGKSLNVITAAAIAAYLLTAR